MKTWLLIDESSLTECFLNALTPSSQDKFDTTAPLQLSISDVFSVPFVGCVVSGVILAGTVKTGDPVLIGVSAALRGQHAIGSGRLTSQSCSSARFARRLHSHQYPQH